MNFAVDELGPPSVFVFFLFSLLWGRQDNVMETARATNRHLTELVWDDKPGRHLSGELIFYYYSLFRGIHSFWCLLYFIYASTQNARKPSTMTLESWHKRSLLYFEVTWACLYTKEWMYSLYLKCVKGKGINCNETSIKEVDIFQHMVVKIKNVITKGRNKTEMCSSL